MQLTAGYKINPALAFELSWQDLGEGTLSAGLSQGAYSASEKLTFSTNLLRADAVLFADVGPNFALFGKLGIASTDVEAKYSYKEVYNDGVYYDEYSESESDSDTGTAYVYGLGASLKLNQIELRGTYEIFKDVEYKAAKEDINNLSVQALMRF